MRIGITERGDAGLDFSWVDKLCDINIIISKNINKSLIEALIENKEKIIFHMTCTGYGRSILEPNVPDIYHTLSGLQRLIDGGFNLRQVVLRIDPIIPTERGIHTAENVLNEFLPLGVTRVRYSFLDIYPHVKDRFKEAGLRLPYNTFTCPDEMKEAALNMLAKYSGLYTFESCAENTPHQIGCISQRDFDILGIHHTAVPAGFQRKGCMCAAGKTELLEGKRRCPHKCLYCYWRD